MNSFIPILSNSSVGHSSSIISSPTSTNTDNPSNMLFPNGRLFQSSSKCINNGTSNSLVPTLSTQTSIAPQLPTPTTMTNTNTTTSTMTFNEEEQHFYNHHIIENFVESVREMNDTVLIPSKLKDLDPSPTTTNTTSSNNAHPTSSNNVLGFLDNNCSPNKLASLNDDLYSYYQMINVVKNDLFEPHTEFDSKKLFQIHKRKLSRTYNNWSTSIANGNGTANPSINGNGLSNSRSVSTTSLSSMNGNNGALLVNSTNGRHSPSSTSDGSSNESDIGNGSGELVASNGNHQNGNTNMIPAPLSSEQLVGQNAKQLTVQFIHHLHSLYAILEHFTHAADFITERYINEFEQSTM